MASTQRIIPFTPPQPISTGAELSPEVAAARRRLLSIMQRAVLALNTEMVRLETTGDLDDRPIEKTYEALGWAVDSFREEQELAAFEAEEDSREPNLFAPSRREVERNRRSMEHIVDGYFLSVRNIVSREFRQGMVDALCTWAFNMEDFEDPYTLGTAEADAYRGGVILGQTVWAKIRSVRDDVSSDHGGN